jgi:signal transduction histidine kinase
VIGLLFALVFGVVMFAGLTMRLKKLSRAVNYFKQQGEVNVSLMPLYREDGDEIDYLTATFLEMANKIHCQLDNLQTSDNLRRELVANVSHDLRTPLATLQGYIETLLLKEDSLSREQRREYIQIALKHCHRLNKLVMELFELAKLDAQETRPLMESFNLSELAYDITQKFSLAARKKKITLQVKVGKGLPFVVADISLIERVLENLIENALRHTPAGGVVSLDLYTDEKGIAVEVSDTGSGIPKAEIPYIFDRFHQLDKSRTSLDGGSGLGLAIVKRIVELHKGVIRVTSEVGKKTVFAFSLKESSW